MLTINNSAQKDRNVALASEKFPLPQIVVYRQLINFSSKSWLIFNKMIMRSALYSTNKLSWIFIVITAGNRHKQNSWFCKEIREDNFGFGGGEFTNTLRKVCTCQKLKFSFLLLEYCKIKECYAVANAFTIRNMYSLFLYMKCNSRKINRPTKNMTKIVTLLHF